MTYWVTQVLNGLSFGMLLFIIAAGLTLTLGVMRVVNLTHGSFYLIGAYIAVETMQSVGNFWISLVVSTAVLLVVGTILYPVLRLTTGDFLRQSLLTFGLIFIVGDIALALFGGDTKSVPQPGSLSGQVEIFGFTYPKYRLFVLIIGLLVAATLEILQRRTLVGATVRAVVDDREMAEGVGRNAWLIGGATFIVAAGLAGFGGAVGGAFIGVYPGADVEVLLLALIVVIVGGMGSLTGALVGAILVGLLDTFGKVLVPELGASFVFILMVVILVIKPTGLAGKPV